MDHVVSAEVAHGHTVFGVENPTGQENCHVLVKKDLSGKVLEQIQAEHWLNQCPVCEGNLHAQLKCSRGSTFQANLNWWEKIRRMCSSCQIIWELVCSNHTEERGDGMITRMSHKLTLLGYNNCFCRALVFPKFNDGGLSIHRGVGHSRLNVICRNQ
ncbi:MAG: hypothetical protein AAB691_01630 [Patescibacteria group bacterium]